MLLSNRPVVCDALCESDDAFLEALDSTYRKLTGSHMIDFSPFAIYWCEGGELPEGYRCWLAQRLSWLRGDPLTGGQTGRWVERHEDREPNAGNGGYEETLAQRRKCHAALYGRFAPEQWQGRRERLQTLLSPLLSAALMPVLAYAGEDELSPGLTVEVVCQRNLDDARALIDRIRGGDPAWAGVVTRLKDSGADLALVAEGLADYDRSGPRDGFDAATPPR